MTRLIRSPAAERDLQNIWLTIAADRPAAATRMLRKIGRSIERLIDYPRLGPRRPDIRPARMLVEGPYLILFQTHPDADEGPIEPVEIVRVVDGRQDLRKLS